MSFVFVNSRESEKEIKELCEKQVGQIDYLTAQLDLTKMEISRQEDVINRQQREISDLKVKLASSLEQMEVRDKSKEYIFE